MNAIPRGSCCPGASPGDAPGTRCIGAATGRRRSLPRRSAHARLRQRRLQAASRRRGAPEFVRPLWGGCTLRSCNRRRGRRRRRRRLSGSPRRKRAERVAAALRCATAGNVFAVRSTTCRSAGQTAAFASSLVRRASSASHPTGGFARKRPDKGVFGPLIDYPTLGCNPWAGRMVFVSATPGHHTEARPMARRAAFPDGKTV